MRAIVCFILFFQLRMFLAATVVANLKPLVALQLMKFPSFSMCSLLP